MSNPIPRTWPRKLLLLLNRRIIFNTWLCSSHRCRDTACWNTADASRCTTPSVCPWQPLLSLSRRWMDMRPKSIRHHRYACEMKWKNHKSACNAYQRDCDGRFLRNIELWAQILCRSGIPQSWKCVVVNCIQQHLMVWHNQKPSNTLSMGVLGEGENLTEVFFKIQNSSSIYDYQPSTTAWQSHWFKCRIADHAMDI